ncbi:MAG: homoserine kinase [Nitrososphaerales archaeon]|nr:homoserine kinase [Nitrososphaerales archaeon]
MERVIVRAPATTSNLGPGFDVHGLALDVMYDTVEITRVDKRGIQIEVEGVGKDRIPTKPSYNTAGRVALEFLRRYGRCGLKIKIIKGIPPGSGLGSSAASAAATSVGLNTFLQTKLDNLSLPEIASKGEIASAGTAHADQVSASIYGGFVIVYSYKPLSVAAFPPPKNVEFALAVPQNIEKTTKQARAVLPRRVSLSNVVNNLGACSLVTAGMILSDPELIGRGMNSDCIVEPARSSLYPGFTKAKLAAIECGALGVTLSGAGPTIIAVVDPLKASAQEVSKAMKLAYESEGVACESYVSRATTGAKVIDTS